MVRSTIVRTATSRSTTTPRSQRRRGTDGIRGYNYGTGTVTIIAEAGAIIEAGRYGISARGHDGGDVSITNYANVTATTALDGSTTGNGSIYIDNHGTINGDVVVGDTQSGDAAFTGNAMVINEAGGIWNLVGSSTFAGTAELVNYGTIDATGASSISTTGTLTFTNAGNVDVQSGDLHVAAAVNGSGQFEIGSGATLELGGASTNNVTFEAGTGSLVLDNPGGFTGKIAGFTGTAPDAAHSDTIDLVGIDYNSANFTETYDAATGQLSVSDGTHQASFTLTNFNGTLDFASDNNGGTLITDPPADTGPANTLPAAGPETSSSSSPLRRNPTGPRRTTIWASTQNVPWLAPSGGLTHNVPWLVPSDDQGGLTHNVPWTVASGGNAGSPTGNGGWIDPHFDGNNPSVDALLKQVALAISHAGDFHFTTGSA